MDVKKKSLNRALRRWKVSPHGDREQGNATQPRAAVVR